MGSYFINSNKAEHVLVCSCIFVACSAVCHILWALDPPPEENFPDSLTVCRQLVSVVEANAQEVDVQMQKVQDRNDTEIQDTNDTEVAV